LSAFIFTRAGAGAVAERSFQAGENYCRLL